MTKPIFTKVVTRVQSLSDVCREGIAFEIPCYQRPYVWPAEDVEKLFDDIVNAQKAGESCYYIGTVLTAEVSSHPVRHGSVHEVHELIDGQQRLTTLVLLALAFFRSGERSYEVAKVATVNDEPRLTFAIRDQVQALLGYWAGLPKCQYPGDEAIDRNPYLTRLAGALGVLEQKVAHLHRHDLAKCGEIAEFVYTNVKWVNNVMPPEMDLNLLFATMNSAGVQLEQVDILKSFLLKQIPCEDKARYESIWLACASMDSYFERNIRQLFPETDWSAVKVEELAEFDESRFVTRADVSEGPRQTEPDEEDGQEEDDTIIRNCNSIITFPLLLMHAYRIHLGFKDRTEPKDIETRLHADRLIESFMPLTQASGDEVKAFFRRLWQVRYQFDLWVVKWVEKGGDDKKNLLLTTVYRNQSKRPYRRVEELSALPMLQSVRYFTSERSAQYWLTPFLGWLIDSGCKVRSKVLEHLEKIDDRLSMAKTTQKDASLQLLLGKEPPLDSVSDILKYLSAKGPGFEHYWFQKVEYLLWKGRSSCEWMNRSQLAGYRITSKNSVEHVHPQNEEKHRHLPDDVLHAFGNLVLLTPSENSSYSHQMVEKKMLDFKKKPTYDSLKLAHIFSIVESNNGWNADGIVSHQEEMLKLIGRHYDSSNPSELASNGPML